MPGFSPAARRLAVTCLLALVLRPAARAESAAPGALPADPFARIEAAVRAERYAPKPAGSEYAGVAATHAAVLETLRTAIAEGNEDHVFSALASLRATAISDELRQACTDLGDTIKKKRAAEKAAEEFETETALKRAGEAVLRAKTPADLDTTQTGLTRLLDGRGGHERGSPTPTRLVARLQAAIGFVNRWQDYLAAVQRGDEATAAQALRSLADTPENRNQPPLVPRSEILARIPANNLPPREPRADPTESDPAVAEILDATHTLDDIPEALRKLGELRRASGRPGSGEHNSDLGAAANVLRGFDKAHRDLEAGRATAIALSNYRSDDTARAALNLRLAPLRDQLIRLALPPLLGDLGERGRGGETLDAFLRRLVEAAKQRADWPSVARGLELAQAIDSAQGIVGGVGARENEAFRQFLAGMNLEAAGQYEQATVAYLLALKTGTFGVPTPLIGAHLAAIEKEHGPEYAAAKAYMLRNPAGDEPSGQRPETTSREGRTRRERASAVLQVPATGAAVVSPSPGT